MLNVLSLLNAKLAKKGKGWVKRAWGALFYYGGIFHLIRLWNNFLGKRLTILMYHRVSNRNVSYLKESLPFLFISESQFEKQLTLIKRWFYVIGFEELEQYKKARLLPRNSLIITFDDGYEDNYYFAYKTLKNHGLKACFFIPANRVGNERAEVYWWDWTYSILQQPPVTSSKENTSKRDTLFNLYQRLGNHLFAELNTWDAQEINNILQTVKKKEKNHSDDVLNENRLLNWTQIREMSEQMEFGSHTCNHFNLCTLSREQVKREVRDSRMIIEDKIGKKILAFSYPAGKSNKDTRRMVEEAGYKFAVTAQKGVNSLKEKFQLRRINIWEKTAVGSSGRFCKGFFAFKILGY